MRRLEELLIQREKLEKEIKEEAKTERINALKVVKNLIKTHKFTTSMLKSVLAKGRTRRKNKKREAI